MGVAQKCTARYGGRGSGSYVLSSPSPACTLRTRSSVRRVFGAARACACASAAVIVVLFGARSNGNTFWKARCVLDVLIRCRHVIMEGFSANAGPFFEFALGAHHRRIILCCFIPLASSTSTPTSRSRGSECDGSGDGPYASTGTSDSGDDDGNEGQRRTDGIGGRSRNAGRAADSVGTTATASRTTSRRAPKSAIAPTRLVAL